MHEHHIIIHTCRCLSLPEWSGVHGMLTTVTSPPLRLGKLTPRYKNKIRDSSVSLTGCHVVGLLVANASWRVVLPRGDDGSSRVWAIHSTCIHGCLDLLV